MLRSIGAVVVGFLALAVVVMLADGLAFLIPDVAYDSDGFNVTKNWMIYLLIVSFLAAMLGGMVTARIAKPRATGPVFSFAGLVVVLGLANAVCQQSQPMREPPADIANRGMTEKAEYARQPPWYAYSLPFLGAAGVLLGGRVCCFSCRA